VVHDGVEPLVGRERFEREAERGDLDGEEVAGDDRGGRVAAVGEINEKNRRLLPRIESEKTTLERERVEERTNRVRDEIALAALEIDDADGGELDGR
jgi:hypothetical protein